MQQVEIEAPVLHNFQTKQRTVLSDSISPLAILGMYNEKEFEEVIGEWCYHYLKNKKGYEKVARIGGPGDKGRDVAAYYDYKASVWDNYQCKHYASPLGPSDIWPEIGKLVYRCYDKELASYPKKYYFVSPRGVSSATHDILREPQKIREGVVKNWSVKTPQEGKVELTESLMQYIQAFDFVIFDYITPDEFLSQFKETPYYTIRFGELAKPRNLEVNLPAEVQECESQYIKKILDAYADHLKTSCEMKSIFDKDPALRDDFERHRTCFFTAETLNQFSRDTYPPGYNYFEKLKSDIYDGIIDSINEDAASGLARLRKVLNRATEIQITNNPLMGEVKPKDRKGICHHLANERDDVKWTK